MSKPYDIALVIGRFQPLCLNHTALFKKAFEVADKLIIGVGTINYKRYKSLLSKENRNLEQSYIDKNLNEYKNKYIFNYDTVSSFLKRSYYLKNRNFEIIEIQDIFDCNKYEEHINKQLEKILINPSMYYRIVLIGENKNTIKCFSNTDILIPKTNMRNFHAKDVRTEIKKDGVSSRLGCVLTEAELRTIINSKE